MKYHANINEFNETRCKQINVNKESENQIIGHFWCAPSHFCIIFMQFPDFGLGSALWSGTNKNRDVSTGPLARPFAHSLAPLTCLLTPDCLLRSRLPLHSLVFSLAHFAHSLARGKVNFWCLKMTWFCPIVQLLSGISCLEQMGGGKLGKRTARGENVVVVNRTPNNFRTYRRHLLGEKLRRSLALSSPHRLFNGFKPPSPTIIYHHLPSHCVVVTESKILLFKYFCLYLCSQTVITFLWK